VKTGRLEPEICYDNGNKHKMKNIGIYRLTPGPRHKRAYFFYGICYNIIETYYALKVTKNGKVKKSKVCFVGVDPTLLARLEKINISLKLPLWPLPRNTVCRCDGVDLVIPA
jgi:hypothetical protein